MISTKTALDRMLKRTKKRNKQSIPINECYNRVLATDALAKHSQPPFDTAAMDGFAIKKRNKIAGTKLTVIGQCAAGENFNGLVKINQAVRIFTGAPLPKGADCIVIQEDVFIKADTIIINQTSETSDFIRKSGSDFSKGYTVKAPARINPVMVSLLAAMNYDKVEVYQTPSVAIISIGDELVEPGNIIPKNKIVASNSYGLAAMLTSFGAAPKVFAISPDTIPSIKEKISEAKSFDLILTIGGASVGAFDLVLESAKSVGLKVVFQSVAMKPGKPLLAGIIENTLMVGLPGNPISSLICCYVMVKPIIEKMLGLAKKNDQLNIIAKLGSDLEANGKREHFLRAILKNDNGSFVVYPQKRQDSSLITELSQSNALIKRAPNAPALPIGQAIEILPFYTDYN